MKKRTFHLTLILVCFSTILTAQNYTNKQLALISYNYTVLQNIKPQFDEFSHLFSGIGGPKVDKVISALKTNSWILLKERLEEETGMYILPIDAHGREFTYDEYGFPNMSINKALRKGSSPFYIKIAVTIADQSGKSEKGYGSAPKKDAKTADPIDKQAVLPAITIEVTTYTKNGIIPLQKVIGTAVASEPWVLNDASFQGLKLSEPFNLDEPQNVMSLFNQALTNLIKNF